MIEVLPASKVLHRKAKGTCVMKSQELVEHFTGKGHKERADALAQSLAKTREPMHGCGHIQMRGVA